jgi:carbonic anhydrase/acetyltransferase-like protein (isoleucine patch superfamily)
MLEPFQGTEPKVHPSVFVADDARVVGDVTVGADSSIWFGAVVRGDEHWIKIGARTNIQDRCVLHVTHDLFPLDIGDDVTVGHGAILHGCLVERMCLIGMGAVVLDGARVGAGSVIGAGALIREGQEVPPGSLVVGVPGRVVREVSSHEREMIRFSAGHYVEMMAAYRGRPREAGR